MKICWDNLERANLSKDGNFRIDKNIYVEMDACKVCGEPYLTKKGKLGPFCSNACARGGENVRCGSLNYNYKGGVFNSGLALYNTYKDRLSLCEDIRRQKNSDMLEVRCVYCGQWFIPAYKAVNRRLAVINMLNQGEGRFYCSENCKLACPTYRQKMYPKGFKHTTSREVSTYLRQMVLERDNWTCQICGKTSKEAQLHVHHMDPVAQNPMFQNDVDSCITLCKKCHKMVHSRIGCRYVDLRCEKDFKDTARVKYVQKENS